MAKKQTDTTHELVFGIHPIIELLKAKRRSLYIIYTTKPTPKSWDQIEHLVPKNIRVQFVTRDVLHRYAGTTDHQGVVALASPFQFRKKEFNPEKQKFLIMIDGVQDTRNLGAILRSAYCTGVDGVIVSKKNSAPVNASTLKASAGLAEHLEILEMPSSLFAVKELKKWGYTLFLAALGGKNVLEVAFNEPLCVVIGNEATGISPEILNSGTRVMLPQRTADISYNASVAAGILLFLIATKNKKI